MPITHINRKGDVYYLHEGKTRTGKPNYFVSKNRAGTLAETIPDGFEVYENPQGQVFLRRAVARNIRPDEIALVEAGIRRHAGLDVFLIDVTTDIIEVYLPNNDIADTLQLLEGLSITSTQRERWQRRGSFSPAMRFLLRDREENQFSVQRWCDRSWVDGWTHDLASGSLEDLVRRYGRHLGKESFFDLM